jgi:DGQHR domain-containing protein
MSSNVNKKGAKLEIPVISGHVLGVKVLRGYAKLSDLSRMSKADVYDQIKNPTGTQRDLNPKHAREAYEYVKTHELAYWAEVFLCARDRKVLQFVPNPNTPNMGMLTINMEIATRPSDIAISRVDGNHRLHYADGSQEDYPAIDKDVSFCLAYDLTLEQEIILFRDINDNQRRMNTSHLDNIQARLTPEEKLKQREPEIYIARKLGQDPDSPLYARVYEGGKKSAGQEIPLRALGLGIKYMLTRPTKLAAMRDAEAQYKLIKNYFLAVKKWQPQSWIEPRKYLVLRGAGLWAICLIGADVIDRVLTKGSFSVESMYNVLTSGQEWDWSNKGDFQGYAGAGGAQQVSGLVIAEFQDDSGVSVKNLFRQIMAND